MNVLMPCGGLCKRFPPGPPKYLRVMNDMRPMFSWALDSVRRFPGGIQPYFAILREHEEQWHVADVIRQFEPAAAILVLDHPTRGPACTVDEMIRQFAIRGSFLVKDCDCAFTVVDTCTAVDVWPKESAIYVAWRETAEGDRASKSWVEIRNGYVADIAEKQRPLDWYCHGGYQFDDAADFLYAYRHVNGASEVFLSHVISKMLGVGVPFKAVEVCDPHDWGTWAKYVSWRQKRKSYFIDLDGVVTNCGTPFGQDGWPTTDVLPDVADKIKSLREAGSAIYFVTARPESAADYTEKSLAAAGIAWDRIFYGIQGGPRVIVNDYADSNPYPACEAVNTWRNSGDWVKKV